jgi:hypothetical protein
VSLRRADRRPASRSPSRRLPDTAGWRERGRKRARPRREHGAATLAANHYADSQGRSVQCARWLVEAGGDVEVRDLQGRTAAELLREGGRDEELRTLLLGSVVG